MKKPAASVPKAFSSTLLVMCSFVGTNMAVSYNEQRVELTPSAHRATNIHIEMVGWAGREVHASNS